MCGIFGYVGQQDPLQACIAGLELLEYRGYDSSGVAGIKNGKLSFCKEIGKLARLKQKLNLEKLNVAIGHTRWATHGKVTEINAHPHTDSLETIALVHNGIIENYDILKSELIACGVSFVSETDTEVVTQLISFHYNGCLVEAVQKTLPQLKGHFAIGVIHKDHPELIVAAARSCPLAVGFDDLGREAMISSDPNTFIGESLNVLFLQADEVVKIEKGQVFLYNPDGIQIAKRGEKLEGRASAPTKEGYTHFMLKEIFEQPHTIENALLNQTQFQTLNPKFRQAKTVWFIGCGTSANAGAIGAYYIEEFARIPAHSEIASEARFRIIPKEALVVAMSQSGETADTLSAVRELKAKGHQVIGICNVKNSTLAREVDACLFLNAGPEMSVCSTKAFTSQLAMLYMFAHFMANIFALDPLKKIPSEIKAVLNQAEGIEQIAQKYSHYNNFFFLGRRTMVATCMEAALKLKEISYVNANGYPAGELKHGPIALLDANFPVIAFCANSQTEDKILSNLQEIKARGAPILAIAPKHMKSVASIADDVIWVVENTDPLAPFASAVVGQLLAYYIALFRGCDIDHPRNLAKSVTVE